MLKDVTGSLTLSAILNENALVFYTNNHVYLLNLDMATTTGGDQAEPAPSIAAKEVRLLDKDVQNYKVCGSYIVWQRGENDIPQDTFYAYDTNDGTAFTITDQPSQVGLTMITCDNKVLRRGEKNAGCNRIINDITIRHQSLFLIITDT